MTATPRGGRVRTDSRRRLDTEARLDDWLSEQVGGIALGQPLRTMRDVADEIGVTPQAVWAQERNARRKIGRALRESA